MAANIYQSVGFYFAVGFQNLGIESIDAAFQSVGGLEVQLETESLKEGGENRFEHALPVRRKYAGLSLKRGLLSPTAGSKITEWCLNAFQSDKIEPTDLDILLLNEEREPLMKWKVIHAWPKSWKFGELNAEKSEVLIESLELQYNRFEFSKP